MAIYFIEIVRKSKSCEGYNLIARMGCKDIDPDIVISNYRAENPLQVKQGDRIQIYELVKEYIVG